MRRSRILIIVVSVCALIALTAVVLWPQPRPAAASHVAAVSAGGQHTCALTTSGGVQCWGRNRFGQLGSGTPGDSTIPVDVVGLETGVVAIASGAVHTCALTTESGVQCWGRIQFDSSTTPLPVAGLETGVSAISGGFHNACALMTSGGVKCWGRNTYGNLGDGTTTFSDTPVDVLEEPGGPPLSGAVAIAAGGDNHTCVLTTTGSVKCWGINVVGELGSSTTELCGGYSCSTVPVDVMGLDSGVAAVAAGAVHTCALTEAGGVKCWGYNAFGQLGNGEASTSAVPTPQDVLSLETGVAAISAGGLHTCALLVTGGVKCWGFNFFGQVGDGTDGPGMDRFTPVDVLGLSSGVVAVSAGAYHTCALTGAGAVTCWGGDDFGQTGDSDGDGCTDFAEHGTAAVLGGQRDHLDYWDFFDTPNASNYRDRHVDITDIAALVLRFGTVSNPPLTEEEALSEALTAPPDRTSYHAAFDRGGPIPGEDLWDLQPPDGAINIIDIGAAIVQFGHTCVSTSAPPPNTTPLATPTPVPTATPQQTPLAAPTPTPVRTVTQQPTPTPTSGAATGCLDGPC